MMDLKQKNGHTSAGRKRNFSIESILQGDILKHPLKSTPGGNVLDNLKDSRADASSRQACAIVPAGTSSELHDDTDLGLLESSSVADDYRRQQHSSSSSDHHPYVAPGLPFALPPVDSQRAEHFDWINCTRYNPPKIHRKYKPTLDHKDLPICCFITFFSMRLTDWHQANKYKIQRGL